MQLRGTIGISIKSKRQKDISVLLSLRLTASYMGFAGVKCTSRAHLCTPALFPSPGAPLASVHATATPSYRLAQTSPFAPSPRQQENPDHKSTCPQGDELYYPRHPLFHRPSDGAADQPGREQPDPAVAQLLIRLVQVRLHTVDTILAHDQALLALVQSLLALLQVAPLLL